MINVRLQASGDVEVTLQLCRAHENDSYYVGRTVWNAAAEEHEAYDEPTPWDAIIEVIRRAVAYEGEIILSGRLRLV
jgi:hypothetical protein